MAGPSEATWFGPPASSSPLLHRLPHLFLFLVPFSSSFISSLSPFPRSTFSVLLPPAQGRSHRPRVPCGGLRPLLEPLLPHKSRHVPKEFQGDINLYEDRCHSEDPLTWKEKAKKKLIRKYYGIVVMCRSEIDYSKK